MQDTVDTAVIAGHVAKAANEWEDTLQQIEKDEEDHQLAIPKSNVEMDEDGDDTSSPLINADGRIKPTTEDVPVTDTSCPRQVTTSAVVEEKDRVVLLKGSSGMTRSTRTLYKTRGSPVTVVPTRMERRHHLVTLMPRSRGSGASWTRQVLF